MPSSWSAAVATLCFFAPGWLALAGWRRAHGAPGPHRPLADGVPALALSALWTGPLTLLCGPTLTDWWARANSSAALAGVLLVVMGGLLVTPWPLGYAAGRLRLSLPAIGRYAALCATTFVATSEMIAAVYHWLRDAKHYLPGAGEESTGYVVAQAGAERRLPARSPEDVASARRQLERAWDA